MGRFPLLKSLHSDRHSQSLGVLKHPSQCQRPLRLHVDNWKKATEAMEKGYVKHVGVMPTIELCG